MSGQDFRKMREAFHEAWKAIPSEKLQELQLRAERISKELQDERLTFSEVSMILIDLVAQSLMTVRTSGEDGASDMAFAWLAELNATADRLAQPGNMKRVEEPN